MKKKTDLTGAQNKQKSGKAPGFGQYKYIKIAICINYAKLCAVDPSRQPILLQYL